MKIRIKTDAQSDPILRAMAREAGLDVEALAEIAVYNLLALWVKERGIDDGGIGVVEGPVEVSGPPPDASLPCGQHGHVCNCEVA